MTEGEIIQELFEGNIIAFPTDTVFGLIALPKEENLKKIYALKQRDKEKPIGLFISKEEELSRFVSFDTREILPVFGFWPGPLTLVLPVHKKALPHIQKEGNIGFRIPADRVLLNILKTTGPLLQTSANISGEPPLKTHTDVIRYFKHEVLTVEGKSSNIVSTVLKYENKKLFVLRKGAIPVIKIKEKSNLTVKVDEFNIIFMCTGNTERSPMAEAMAKKLFSNFKVNIKSRGILPLDTPYSKIAQNAVEKLGYKRIEGVSRILTEEDLQWADIVLAMETKHIEVIRQDFPLYADKAFLFGENNILDPVGLGEKTHELVAKIIETTLKNRWMKFIKEFF